MAPKRGSTSQQHLASCIAQPEVLLSSQGERFTYPMCASEASMRGSWHTHVAVVPYEGAAIWPGGFLRLSPMWVVLVPCLSASLPAARAASCAQRSTLARWTH